MNPTTMKALLEAMQLVQLGTSVVRSLAAAVRAAGGTVEEDDVLIRKLLDNSEAGKAEAQQVMDNLRAQL